MSKLPWEESDGSCVGACIGCLAMLVALAFLVGCLGSAIKWIVWSWSW